jgi:hypothetical protein
MTDQLFKDLRKPFHPSIVEWKPGALNQDRTKALAMPFADVRTYQDRLDQVCALRWSVTFTPWGERLICHLTIDGVTRSSTGEGDSQAERAEFAGTAAEAQAFKRACSAFGLGRYLYSLPTLWVEYDAGSKSFTDKAKARLTQIINQHYRRELEETESAPAVATDLEQRGPEGTPDLLTTSTDQPAAQLVQEFDALGQELYGEQWEHVRRHNVERVSNGQTADSNQLTPEQLQKLIDGLKSLKAKRNKGAKKQPVPNANGAPGLSVANS